MTEVTTHELMKEQLKIEQKMISRGASHFRRNISKAQENGRESSTVYGSTLVSAAIAPVAEKIQEFLKEAAGKAGRKHIAVKYLQLVPADVAAFIAVKVCLDGISMRKTLQNVATRIGRDIEDEVKITVFENAKKPLFAKIKKSVDKSSHAGYKSRVYGYAMNKYGVEWTPWPVTDKLHLGQKLIDCILQARKLIRVVSLNGKKVIKTATSVKKTSQYYLTGTSGTMAWIQKKIADTELMVPELLPTVVPPKPWTTVVGGGYYSPELPQTKLIKTNNENYLEELSNMRDELDVVYDTVNGLQNTAFHVHPEVHEVMKHFWNMGNDTAGLPARDDRPLPHCPKCGNAVVAGEKHECFEELRDEDPDTFKSWKKEASKVHEKNAKLFSKRLQVAQTMKVASDFAGYERIYFPYQMDFRGRVYAMPMYLNPQGADYAKGLLSFAEGKPITDDEGSRWLAIHGANVWGEDKCSLDARVQWVHNHEQEIKAVAENPYDCQWWMDADKPWQFLAFCFEWAEFRAHGYGYVSTLPVHMDGTCNGLQLFSLMLRDEIGGKAVNCVPCDEPQDVYQAVCDLFMQELNRMAVEGVKVFKDNGDLQWDEQDMAKKWLSLNPDRKCTKRQVMVLPYGGTQQSCREYTEEYLKKKFEDTPNPWDDETFAPSLFASKIIWDAIGRVVIAARDAMAWLQKVSRVASSEGLPVNWTTPAGLPILQAYPEMSMRRVKTQLNGAIFKLALREQTGKLDKRRQASAISPNFVHSLDAAGLQLSVVASLKEGVTEFAMVHDSYGVPAQDAPIMARCLRKVFVDMFKKHDVLAELRDSVLAIVDEKKAKDIPPLPSHGNMDIDQVEKCDFFFA